MVGNLTCMGLSHALNVSERLDLRWKVSGAPQLSATVRGFVAGTDAFCYFVEGNSRHLNTQAELMPAAEYTWMVETQTERGVYRSSPARFRTASGKFDSRAKWISDGRRFLSHDDGEKSPVLALTKKFRLEEVPQTAAIADICGLGLYEFYLNGRRVGDRVLDPAFTDYTRRCLYATYDVSEFLCKGENTVEVLLGDGWYNQTTRDTWGFYLAPWRDYPKLLFQLRCGSFCLFSDESWQMTYSAVVSSVLRAGEALNEFSAPVRIGSASVVVPPGGKLLPQQLPPVRECEQLVPVSEWKTDGRMFYDFGRNISGYCVATVRAQPGSEITLTYSDRITDGLADNRSNSMYLYNPGLAYQCDRVTVGRAGKALYHPKFTYHGFRYMVAEGNSAFSLEDLSARFVHTDLKRIGRFSCSDPLLCRLYDMSVNAILSNFIGFPSDCPHREKNGWTGDAQLSLETCVQTFDMQEAYRKWLFDVADTQRPSGQICAVAPTCGWGYNWGSGPAWDAALFRLTRALYYYYGDRVTAEELLPVMERYYDYLSGYEKDGLVNVGLGDWNYPKNISFAICPTELTDSCYRAYMADVLAELAEEFAPGRSQKYIRDGEQIRQALRRKYAGHERSLTGMAALTVFGVSDESLRVFDYLTQNGCLPHFGILGAKFVCDLLAEAGRSDLLFHLLSRKDYPSFGYWAEQGQTSLCEDFELTNSLNHHMYSCISDAMIRTFAGFRPGREFQEAVIAPSLPAELDRVDYSCETPCGSLSVSVHRQGKRMNVSVFVPMDFRAVLHTPQDAVTLSAGEMQFSWNIE